jgi:hypothetical protein
MPRRSTSYLDPCTRTRGKAQHLAFWLHIHIDDGLLPSHFQSERLYEEDWICAVARDSRFGDRLPLKQYLAGSHIVDMRECKQFQTSNWRLSVQNAALVFSCLISAWPCNAFPAPNWSLCAETDFQLAVPRGNESR